MTDQHEMRMIHGRIKAVYTDSRGREYIIVDGLKVYL